MNDHGENIQDTKSLLGLMNSLHTAGELGQGKQQVGAEGKRQAGGRNDRKVKRKRFYFERKRQTRKKKIHTCILRNLLLCTLKHNHQMCSSISKRSSLKKRRPERERGI